MKLKLFEEFLNLENHYPYKLIGTEVFQQTSTDWGHYDFIYEFKSKDNKVYNLCLVYYDHDKSISPDWAEKEDFELMRQHKIDKYESKTKLGDININHMETLLNTVFNITVDFINEYVVKKVMIGSYTKYKYREYKRMILEMDDLEIIEDKIIQKGEYGNDWPKDTYYSLEFRKKNDKNKELTEGYLGGGFWYNSDPFPKEYDKNIINILSNTGDKRINKLLFKIIMGYNKDKKKERVEEIITIVQDKYPEIYDDIKDDIFNLI